MKHFLVSHCWGPPPDPSGELQGREGTVLSKTTLPLWPEDLPLDNLPLVFQYAVRACLSFGFEYIWFDGFCIIQESLEEWQTQSAAIGSGYKFAWLIPLYFLRDPTTRGRSSCVLGFRAWSLVLEARMHLSLTVISNRKVVEARHDLLQGKARLHWNFSLIPKGRIFPTRPYLSEAGCTNHVTSHAVH